MITTEDKMYIPSVNIEYQKPADFEYLVTPNARAVLGEMIDRFHTGDHSFQIIGSYGTGKSSFLMELQSELLKAESDFIPNKTTFNGFEDFAFLNVVGDYNSLANLMGNKLASVDFSNGNVLSALDDYYKHAQGEGKFLFVFIDEFGKVLEHAAGSPETELYFLQQLAEYANAPQRNMILITVLHQNFNAYAMKLSDAQRNEWNKVKGRFHDIVFHEPVEQLLYLASVQLGEQDRRKNKVSKDIRGICDLATETKFVSSELDAKVIKTLAPLEPFSATALTLAFQRYGQNERSLFSFLSAKGKGSLQEYRNENDGYYSLSQAYDYIAYNFYFALTSVNADTSGWRMLKVALERVESGVNGITEIDESKKVIKAIGLINIFGTGETSLNKEALCEYCKLALSIDSPSDVIEKLEKARIIRFANYKQRYVLFEGTDVDIEYELGKASTVVPKLKLSADTLVPYFREKVVLASSEYYRTGCPRYFEFRLADGSLPNEIQPTGNIDGYIALTFPETVDERNEIINASAKDKRAIAYVLFNQVDKLSDCLWEIDKLEYLRKHVLDREDKVAMREVGHQFAFKVSELDKALNQSLYKAEGDVEWIYRGESILIENLRQFQMLLNRICADVYSKTPVVRCEMLNKEKPSANITSARMEVLKAMLERADEEMLGFSDGFKPTRTIYEIVLHGNGIHREADDGFELAEPDKENIMAAWDACLDFLNRSKEKPLKLTELAKILQSAPYKMKQGLIDLWIPMFFIVEQSKYALFSEGKYITNITPEMLELLPKNMRDYTIKAFSQESIRKEIFNKYREFLRKPETDFIDRNSFNNTYNQFFIFYNKLNEYAKQTRKFDSPYTAKFRDVLATATDPEKAIFVDLPESLGLNSSTLNDDDACNTFLRQLRTSVHELVVCYDAFIDRIEKNVVEALGLHGSFDAYKHELELRYGHVKKNLLSTKCRAFLQRVMSPSAGKREFYEKIGSVIYDKDLKLTKDAEEDYLIDNILYLFRELDRFVDISKHDEKTNEIFSFEMASSKGENVKNRTLVLSKTQAKALEDVEAKIENALSGNVDVDAAALLRLLAKRMKK